MSSRTIIVALAVAIAACIAIGASTPVEAQYCEGTVHGLSRHYDLATGSGFLAVRKRATSSSPMLAQLFNGDKVEIFDRRGSWYRIFTGSVEGWAHRKWMRNSCNY